MHTCTSRVILGLGVEVERDMLTPSGFRALRSDDYGLLLGEVRIRAMSRTLEDPSVHLVIFGGRKPLRTDPNVLINEAEAIREILIEEHGGDPRRITPLSIGLNTEGNVIGIRTFYVEHMLNGRKFEALTNRYHVERLAWYFEKYDCPIPIMTAESLIERHERPLHQAAYSHPLYLKRLESERDGVRALRNGDYVSSYRAV